MQAGFPSDIQWLEQELLKYHSQAQKRHEPHHIGHQGQDDVGALGRIETETPYQQRNGPSRQAAKKAVARLTCNQGNRLRSEKRMLEKAI